MTEKEKRIQNALGTMKRQKFIIARWGDIDGYLDGLKEALENFGLFIYPDCNPLDDPGVLGVIISNEELTDTQVEQLCRQRYKEDEK